MKKFAALSVLGLSMFFATNSFAQNSAEQIADNKMKTKEVIESIPSLKIIAADIQKFEAKTEGRKEEYKNSNADLKALKTKYLIELKNQIDANDGNVKVVEILKSEAEKTKKEIETLK